MSKPNGVKSRSRGLPCDFDAIAAELMPTPRKMFAILSDGEVHSHDELFRCLYDLDAPISNIQTHISTIRKVIGPRGLVIDSVIGYAYRRGYRMSRHVGKSD